MKAKILEIWNINEWNGKFGLTYFIKLRLDNWERITLWKQKKDAFKVGDEVNYEVVEAGKKWKEIKDNFKKSYWDNGKSATIGMAIKLWFELVYKDKGLEEAKKLAKEILLFAQELAWESNVESPKDTETTNQPKHDDELPF